MTIRWGRRSTGGIVKAGHGGWSLRVYVDGPPCVQYIDPETGDGVAVTRWNIPAAIRFARAKSEAQRRSRRDYAQAIGVPPAARLRETR